MIYGSSPLHVLTLVPVANVIEESVRIDVVGELVVEPKREREREIEGEYENGSENGIRSRSGSESESESESEFNEKTYCKKVQDLLAVGFYLWFLLVFIGGIIVLLVWLNNPTMFGTQETY
jgi:hypothetical protein